LKEQISNSVQKHDKASSKIKKKGVGVNKWYYWTPLALPGNWIAPYHTTNSNPWLHSD